MLLLVREDGAGEVSWWWDSKTDTYSRCINGECLPLTKIDFLQDTICRYPNSQHCDGVEKWIEAGRPN